ncbi:MAG: hypothetical protein ACKO3Q_12055, partial [Betaproteobacteria bacterium]
VENLQLLRWKVRRKPLDEQGREMARSGPETSARIKAATAELCTIFLRRSLRDLGQQGLDAQGGHGG